MRETRKTAQETNSTNENEKWPESKGENMKVVSLKPKQDRVSRRREQLTMTNTHTYTTI